MSFPRLALVAAFLLAGCAAATQDIWIKPGTSGLQAEQDFLTCAAKARRDFPEAPRIATAPRVTIGGGVCRSNVCVGVNNAPEVFDTDRNEALRDRATAACMLAAGYDLAALPACPAGPVTTLESQPFDTRGLCVAGGRIAAP